MEVGNTLQFEATLSPGNPTVEIVEWKVTRISGTGTVATIDQNGLLTALGPGSVLVTATSLNGAGETNYTGEMEIDVIEEDEGEITSINEPYLKNPLIYPNPNLNGNFFIKGMNNMNTVKIMDLKGNQVKVLDVLNQSIVEVQINVSPGIYVIQLSNDQGFVHKKLIVK